MNKNLHDQQKHTEHAHYFALVSGQVIALSVAAVFTLTVYAQVDPVFKRSMGFMFNPYVESAQTQVASALSLFNL